VKKKTDVQSDAVKVASEEAQLHARIRSLVFDRTTAMAALSGMTRDEFVNDCLDKATARLKGIQEELRSERLK